MKRINLDLRKSSAGIVVFSGAAMMLLTSGCAIWKREPEPRLLGAREVVPAPYFQPGGEVPAEPGFDDGMEDFETPETMDFEDTDMEESDDGVGVTTPAAPDTSTLSYTVEKGDSLWKIAREYGVSYKELAAYNDLDPDDTLVVGTTLTIPPGGSAEAPDAEDDSSSQPTTRGTSTRSVERESIPSDRKYTVKSGDSLWTVARKFGVKIPELKAVNDMSSDTIHPGDVLVLPTSADTEDSGTDDTDVTVDTPEEPDATDDDGEPDVETRIVEDDGDEGDEVPESNISNLLEHTVMEGDTLEEIADMYGTSVPAIKRANDNIDSDDDLEVNMSIKVPFE